MRKRGVMVRHSRRVVFLALGLVGGLAVAVLVAEGVLRLADRPRSGPVGWKSRQQGIRQREIHELGYRGRSIRYEESDFVVLLVGDSQVEAPAHAFGSMPEDLLEEALVRRLGCPSPPLSLPFSARAVRVVSLGSAGYGQDQELLALDEYLERYRADLVVLWETPPNDFWNNMFPTHFLAPKPTFVLEDGQLVPPAESILDADHEWRLTRAIERLVGADRLWARRVPLPPSYVPVSDPAGTVDPNWEEWAGEWDDMELERTPLDVYLTPPSPRMRYAIALTRQLVLRMQSLAAGHGARFLAFHTHLRTETRAGALQHYRAYVAEEPQLYSLRGKVYRASRAQVRETMAEVNAGIPSFEMELALTEPWVSLRDRHLDARGNAEAMERLADRIAGDLITLEAERRTTASPNAPMDPPRAASGEEPTAPR